MVVVVVVGGVLEVVVVVAEVAVVVAAEVVSAEVVVVVKEGGRSFVGHAMHADVQTQLLAVLSQERTIPARPVQARLRVGAQLTRVGSAEAQKLSAL